MLFGQNRKGRGVSDKWKFVYITPFVIVVMVFTTFENFELSHLQEEEVAWTTGQVVEVRALPVKSKSEKLTLRITLDSKEAYFNFKGDPLFIQDVFREMNNNADIKIGYYPSIFPFSRFRKGFTGQIILKNDECLYSFKEGRKHVQNNWKIGIFLVTVFVLTYLFLLLRWYG